MVIMEEQLGVAPVAPRSRFMVAHGQDQQLFGLGAGLDQATVTATAMGLAMLSAGVYALTGIKKGRKQGLNNTLLGGLGLGLGTVGAVKLWDTYKPVA